MKSRPFVDAVRSLAADQGKPLEHVMIDAWAPDVRGTSSGLFRKAMRGERRPTPALMEAVAGALGVEPTCFAEYRLALARLALDEREVGVPAALAALDQHENALALLRTAVDEPLVTVPSFRASARAILALADAELTRQPDLRWRLDAP